MCVCGGGGGYGCVCVREGGKEERLGERCTRVCLDWESFGAAMYTMQTVIYIQCC